MRLYHWAAGVACFAFMAVGCHDSPIGDDFADKHYGAQGSIAIPSNVQEGFFDLANPDEAGIAFDLDTKGEEVSSTEVMVTHSGGGSGVFETVTSFPATIDVPLDQLLSALGMTLEEVEVGDEVTFTFESVSTTGTYKSGEVLVVPFSCKSDLSGKMDFVTSNYFCSGNDLTGQVEMSEDGAGKYVFDDWTFGTYVECYGGPAAGFGTLQFEDVCNKIDIKGEDGYGDGWEFIINSVNGDEMSINWSNDYGEFGTTILTRQDGRDWPSLSN